jgi:hypothetical protein
MTIKTTPDPSPSTQKAWEFNLKLEKKTIKTFVYSDTGKDIASRFPNYKVTNIKQIPDPLKDVAESGWKPKAKYS